MAHLEDYAVEPLLSTEGWAYASLPPVEQGDPGRFNTLFGRDSLIFALQVLPDHPAVAADTLRTHAKLQAQSNDPALDAEPGKIVHEFWTQAPQRLVDAGWPIRDGRMRYYGTADATSWFLVVLATAVQAGQPGLVSELEHAWRAAGSWLEGALARGDGLVRYARSAGQKGGLTQQGWRDSFRPSRNPHGNGIVRLDGSEPDAPLADADCQAVAVAALRALASLDPARATHWTGLADALRARVSTAFGPDVMAVEPSGDPVPGAGSQLGWLLWANALTDETKHIVAQRLADPDVLTGFGLRTLTDQHPGFAPAAYHRGAVWPFDSWLGWGGLRAAGLHDAAERVRTGVLQALTQLGRAPELYAVTGAGEVAPIAVANRVQAWTVGAARALISEWDGLPR